MSYSLPLTNFFTVFRQPTGLAIMASLGIHGIVGVGLEQVPILSKSKEISPVQLVELTPEQLSFLPEFSQPELAKMKFDTLVPPSPGEAGSGLPVVPPQTEPLKPWTLPEGASLYNNQNKVTLPNLENWPPTPPEINTTPLNQNNSLTQSGQTQQQLPYRSPFKDILSQLPPPPPVAPSNNQYDGLSQSPQQQLYTVPTIPQQLYTVPTVPVSPQNLPPNQGFNPNFPPTQVTPPNPQQIPEWEFPDRPSIDPDDLAMNSPGSRLPGGVAPGQQMGSAEALLDTQQQINRSFVTPPGQNPVPNPENQQTSPDDPELLDGLDPDAWAYQQKLRQEFLASQGTSTQSPSNSEESGTVASQPAFSPNSEPESNTQGEVSGTRKLQQAFSSTIPQQSSQEETTNPESQRQLVPGLKPEVWAYYQALRQEQLARQVAANQGKAQTQEDSTRQQLAGPGEAQTTAEANSQPVLEGSQPGNQEPEFAEKDAPQELTIHQQRMLAYNAQLVEENRRQAQEGSLSEEEEAMLAGGAEFYTWLMELRQQLPNVTAKTPSSIADNYPLAACPEKLEGMAVVGTVVNSNGEMIKSPQVLLGSGSEILDDEALKYIESVQFPSHEQPRAYQYSFEFNYNDEICAIASPEKGSPIQTNNSQLGTGESESEAINSEESEAIAPLEDIEAINSEELETEELETEALQPQVESEKPTAASPEVTEERELPALPPSDDLLMLEAEPENANKYQIYAPVEIPTMQDR